MGFQNGVPVDGADIRALVERRVPGYSLEGPLYTSQQVFDHDLDAIFGRHWLFCATEAEVAEPGDYVTMDVGPYSVILIRDDDEQIRAHHNVCRHRGSRILEEPCGDVGNLVCPYHQWTYRADGSLIHAESQPEDFDKSRFGLKPVHVRNVAGLVFVCFADEPPTDFDEVAAKIEPYLSPFGLKDAKVAHQTDLVEHGNWKLVMENNRECYHCDVGHPELLSAYFPFNRVSDVEMSPRMKLYYERFVEAGRQLQEAKASTGIPDQPLRELDNRPSGFTIDHLPLDGQGVSFGVQGAAVSKKRMGDIPVAAFGDLYLHFQPNSWFHFLSDHAVVFRVLPLGPDRSMVRSTWLVHKDAVEGVDYDVDTLTMVWKATNAQDRSFVEKAQRGATSPAYEPGPYAPIEDDVEAFTNWYITRTRAHLERNGAQPAETAGAASA